MTGNQRGITALVCGLIMGTCGYLILEGCSASQQATEKQIVQGAETAAPLACEAEQLFIHDPTMGNICATLAELEHAKLATQSSDIHTLCTCIMADRKDAGK